MPTVFDSSAGLQTLTNGAGQVLGYLGPGNSVTQDANIAQAFQTEMGLIPSNYSGNTLSSTTGGTGGGGTASQPATSVFDTTVTNLNELLGALPGQQTTAETKVGNLYDTGLTNLTSARDQGLETNEANRSRSLRDLYSGIRGSQQAFGNQLGTFGAGSSSAADISAPFAFAKLAGQGSTDINTSFGSAANNITNEFTRQLSDLDVWKNNSMLDIIDKFDAIKLDIQNDIRLTEAEKAAYLAEAQSGAVSSLSQLDNDYNQIANQYVAGIQAPEVNAQGVSAGVLDAQNYRSPGYFLSNNPSYGGGSAAPSSIGTSQRERQGLTFF